MSRRQVLEHWAQHPMFCDWFTASLAAAPYAAFFWETPRWLRATLDAPYEQCLTDAPALAGLEAAPGPFRRYMRADEPVAVFRSLGGDATLLAPSSATGSHPHLAHFVRAASRVASRALWAALPQAVEAQLDCSCWVSTSGLGVSWLHVRVDSRPKYYVHRDYRA